MAAGPGAAEPEHAPRGGAHVGVDDLAVEEGHDPREREHGTHDEHLLELPDAQPLPDEDTGAALDEPCLQAAAVEPETDTDTDDREAGVLEAIDAIRPALQSDGGDIVFNGIDADSAVHVTLVGACGTCPVSMMTLKAGVERIIMDRVPGITEVISE